MHLRAPLPFSLLITACLAAATAAAAAQAGAKSWLDQPVVNWNKAGAAIPKVESRVEARCNATVRQPDSAADKQLTAAGWRLFGSVESYSGTSIVHAMANADGMCRPWEFHAFVFIDGRFAGTLTPTPMNSRADGVEGRTWLTSASDIRVEFSRYKDTDPLCCPSGKTSAPYSITRTAQGPVVVPGKPEQTVWQPSAK